MSAGAATAAATAVAPVVPALHGASAPPLFEIGDRVESRDGDDVGTVAGRRDVSAGDPRAYLLILRRRLFGLLRDTYLVPQAWAQRRATGARCVTLSATVAEVVASPRLRTDAAIRSDVAEALRPGGVSPTEARVRIAVTDGVVELRGNSRNPRDTLAMVGLAWRVPGVLRVNDRLHDDETLTFAVAQALTTDPDTRRAHFIVRSRMGAVDLAGEVPSASVGETATALAGAVPGVASVHTDAPVRHRTATTPEQS